MARLVTTVQRYTGTTAQRVALVTTSINPGSTFFDEDEGVLYSLSRATPRVWVPKRVAMDGISDLATEATLSTLEGKAATEAKQDNTIAAINNIERVAADSGIATAGGNDTLTDDTKSWGVDAFTGSVVEITAGTGVGQLRQVASNTVDTLTVSPNWTTNPDATSQYEIRFSGKLGTDLTHVGGEAVVDGTIKSQLTGSSVVDGALQTRGKVRYVTSTIIDAASIIAGGDTGNISIGTDGTESEIWLAVAIDKQPWSATRGPGAISQYSGTYPNIRAVQTETYELVRPLEVLLIGIDSGQIALAPVDSWANAKAAIRPIHGSNAIIRIANSHSTDVATCTVKVIRVWR